MFVLGREENRMGREGKKATCVYETAPTYLTCYLMLPATLDLDI